MAATCDAAFLPPPSTRVQAIAPAAPNQKIHWYRFLVPCQVVFWLGVIVMAWMNINEYDKLKKKMRRRHIQYDDDPKVMWAMVRKEFGPEQGLSLIEVGGSAFVAAFTSVILMLSFSL